MSVISCAAGHHFAAQARVLVDLEHVDAHVRHAKIDGRLYGGLPAFCGLMGQSGDEIDVDIRNSSPAKAFHVVEYGCFLVQAPDRSRFLIYERLYTKTHPVDAAS